MLWLTGNAARHNAGTVPGNVHTNSGSRYSTTDQAHGSATGNAACGRWARQSWPAAAAAEEGGWCFVVFCYVLSVVSVLAMLVYDSVILSWLQKDPAVAFLKDFRL